MPLQKFNIPDLYRFSRCIVWALLLAACGENRSLSPDAAGEFVVDLTGGATMAFVWIAPGTFHMGSPRGEEGRGPDESPQHQVEITRGFYLGKFEITQRQWRAVMGGGRWRTGSSLVCAGGGRR